MFRLQADSDESRRDPLKAGHCGQHAQQYRGLELSWIAKNAMEDAMGKELYLLRIADSPFSMMLHPPELLRRDSPVPERAG